MKKAGISKHLAFDLGAESGRAILGTLENGILEIKEIHRFQTGIFELDGGKFWNIYRMFEEFIKALGMVRDTPPDTIGVDTWGVDFTMLDRDGNIIALPFSYRDSRTEGAMESYFRKVSPDRVYELTGIQLIGLNTIYQLESMVRDRSPILDIGLELLFIPDLFHYLLTGIKKTEFTFATTSQLYNPRLGTWDNELIVNLPVNRSIFGKIVAPGTVIGRLSDGICKKTCLPPVPVVAVATHDTASAVASIPACGDNFAYISSGTWSLVGVESSEPLITKKTFELNLTNEGGVGGRWRVLKNIMGLWLLQECRRSWSRSTGKELGYDELMEMALMAAPFQSFLDPDNPSFLAPSDMPDAIAEFCLRTDQKVPGTYGEFTRCILQSLALKYRLVLDELKDVTPHEINKIHVIGGGSKNTVLCQFTADATGLPVYAGPVEATAIGNLLVQAMAVGTVGSLDDLRDVVSRSFTISNYRPSLDTSGWVNAFPRFSRFCRPDCFP